MATFLTFIATNPLGTIGMAMGGGAATAIPVLGVLAILGCVAVATGGTGFALGLLF